MNIQNMFQKDINRDINGVIKVSQNDDNSLHQELSEYIITKELRRHFRTFFDNYSKAIDYPTDKIGVWISGFFGSGKSHFLKYCHTFLKTKKYAARKQWTTSQTNLTIPLCTPLLSNASRCLRNRYCLISI